MIFKMAIRNLLRRPMQSVLAAGAVAGGLALIIFTTNFQDGSWAGVVRDTIRATSGHVVVQAPGYQKQQDSNLLLEKSSELAQRLQEALPQSTVVRRLALQGMVASPNNSVAVAINGVDAKAEKPLSQMSDKLIEGSWLPEKGEGLLIGYRLAKRLQVGVGEKVVLTASFRGEIQGFPFRVSGIFKTQSPALDNFYALAPLQVLQEMLPDVEDPATQVSVILDSAKAPPELRDQVRALVGEGPEVLRWEESIPELYNAERLDKASAAIMWVFLGILVSIGILNVLLMSLFQRTRELGMLQAMGLRPAGVIKLLMVEGLMLGVAGGIFGFIAGAAMSYPIVEYGLDLAVFQNSAPIANVAIDTLIKGQFVWDKAALWTLYHIALAVLASIWPALRAGALEPVEALRAN